MVDTLLIPLLKIVIVLNATLVAVTYMVLLERKVIAWAQSRLGPMRVGPYGILQPVADAVKLMIKEDITPVRADKWVFTAAPIISMVPALIVYAVIPFGPEVSLFGRKVNLFIWIRATLPRYRYDQLMRLGWKVLIPLAIANLVITGIVKVLLS